MTGELDQSQQIALPSKDIIIRGYKLKTADVQRILDRLQTVLRGAGEAEVNGYVKPADTDQEKWKENKDDALEKAFRVTTTVTGENGSSVFAPNTTSVFGPITPSIIDTIYCTNQTAYGSFFGRNSQNTFELILDFSPSPLLDSSNPVSSPTPNRSMLRVKGANVGWVAAIEAAVFEVLRGHENRVKFLHRAFVYDAGLIIFAIPLSLYAIYLFDIFLEQNSLNFNSFLKSASFVYVFLVSIWIYRIFFGFLKRAFPVMELETDISRSRGYRSGILWLLGVVAAAGITKLIFG